MSLSLGAEPYRMGTARGRKGNFPKKVVLLAPHTNEHPAVVPFQMALASRLRKEGVEVGMRNRTGMMERIWELTKFTRKENPEMASYEQKALVSILSTEDALLRLREIHPILAGSPDAFALELHAMDAGFSENQYHYATAEKRGFIRVRGTGMLIAREPLKFFNDALEGAEDPCTEAFSSIENRISAHHREEARKALHDLVKKICSFCGINLEEAVSESKKLLSGLSRCRGRFALVEVPSDEEFLKKGHPMYDSYFTISHEGGIAYSGEINRFEECYGSCTRKSIGFTEKDIEAVLPLLRV